MSKTATPAFEHLSFEFVSDFRFRVSDFLAWHGARLNRVEQQAERAVRLGAVLHPAAEQDYVALFVRHIEDSRSARDDAFALEETTLQHVLVGIARHELDPFGIGARLLGPP